MKSPAIPILGRIKAMFAKRLRKSEQSFALESLNPLWNMTAHEAQSIFDYARRGNYARLQYLYNEIEGKDPTLLTCVQRRASAISELDWRVVRSDQRLNRNIEQSLIDEQIECVETAIAKIENFPDAVERLSLAAFRGFAHISPVHNLSGDVTHFELIDNWNMCWDRVHKRWLWNPNATSFVDPSEASSDLTPIPSEELVSVVGDRAIDWPGLFIYLRTSIGERDWGRFLETYGIPPVILTMPELTSEQEAEKFVEAATEVYEGGNGVVPYGTNVSYASEIRGTNPFTEFIEHQQKLMVLMATGGTLTSLAESGSGTLAGNAQMDVWMQIVRRDVRRIGNAINKQLCEDIVRKNFKGKPILAEFKFDTEPPKDPKDILDLASTASSAGFEMDAEELSQATGFTIRKKPAEGGMGFNAEPPNNGKPTTPSIVIPDEPKNKEVVENADGAEVITNVTPAEAIKRIKHLKANDQRLYEKGKPRYTDYWDDLSRAERDAIIVWYLEHLPKGAYRRANIFGRLQDEIGIGAANHFDFDWDKFYQGIASRNENKYSASTTHGLDEFVVKNGGEYFSRGTSSENTDLSQYNAEDEGDPNKLSSQNQTPSTPVFAANNAMSDLIESLQVDFKPIADRVNAILQMPEEERATAATQLLNELDSLVPDDPAMAEVIAEQMKEAFDKQITKQPQGNAAAANKVIPNGKK